MATTVSNTNSNSISNSCQSIVSTSLSAGGGITGNTSGGIRSGHYINGTGSLGRLKYHKSLNASDEELEYSQLSQSTHILGRVRSERFLASKSDEDRRRRTIIVEKQHDSYGFTLQSYGIHYKKDEEIEMITYVDYVEYDGPAYKAGMREGDVILSINGTDMEKADHKTLVDFIKSCDTRMRMVVQFEDCVRKVDLHMRYMQLQGMLQSKMNELERICLRERELLEGRWKTHSLPARKKANTSPIDVDVGIAANNADANFYRPTLSTEDVAHATRNHHSLQAIIPPPAQFMLSYHYLDPNNRYILKPASSNGSGDYFVSFGDNIRRSPSDQHFILTRTSSADTTNASFMQSYTTNPQQKISIVAGEPPAPPPRTCEKHKPPNKHQQQQQQEQQNAKITNENTMQNAKAQKSKHSCHGHSCNPCIGHFRWKSAEKAAAAAAAAAANASAGNADNVSLDAYDLASPCCDAHCVPTRRRTRHHKEHTHKHKHRDRDRDRETTKERAQSAHEKTHLQNVSPGMTARHAPHHHHHHHHSSVDAHQHQQHQQQQQQQHQHQSHTTSLHYYQQQPQSQLQQQQHQQQQQIKHACDSRNGSTRSHYFDLAAGMASHCSLHSCTSSELAAADNTSYATSLSTDTLYWDPKSENAVSSRQHSTKSKHSYQQHPQQQQQQQPQQQHTQQQLKQQQQQHQQQNQQAQHLHGLYQQRYHITATQVQPSQIYPNTGGYVHKPKSWDNLTAKAIGGYGFGYGYLDTVTIKPAVKLQIAQQRHSIPRKNPYGRYSTYTDTVENYAPPPSQFVEELTTTTTTTTITAKSTEELIACDCLTKQQQQALKAAQLQIGQNRQLSHQNACQMGGYYSHLPRPTTDAATSTVSEITRL